MREIETLLPHRAPFLYVDEILSATDEEITGIKTFQPEHFPHSYEPSVHFVPGVILIESMAQCGGAGLSKLKQSKRLFGLAQIESARFLEKVSYGDTVKFLIHNIRVSTRLVKQTGKAFVNDLLVAEATWMCVRFKQS